MSIDRKTHPALELIMKIVALLVVFVAVPLVFMNGRQFTRLLRGAGIKIHENYTGGRLIAEFSCASGNLLRSIPSSSPYRGQEWALDLRRFTVRKVDFRPGSGVGIAPRLNLTCEFPGRQPDPHHSENRFALPVIHVYIDAPGGSAEAPPSPLAAEVEMAGDWDYQVIIDGWHDQARVYDHQGQLLGRGVGLFVDYDYAPAPDGAARPVTATRITAAIPSELFTPRRQGTWKYFVAVGLADLNSPSLMLPADAPGQPQIFDSLAVQGRRILPVNVEGF